MDRRGKGKWRENYALLLLVMMGFTNQNRITVMTIMDFSSCALQILLYRSLLFGPLQHLMMSMSG